MSLQDEIRSCQRCVLFSKMETSPIPPEWSGTPEVMFVVDTTISMAHDFAQTPTIGATRIRFIHLIEEVFDDWYITPLVKCRPKNSTYLVKDYKECTQWIQYEINKIAPKIIVTCGSNATKYVEGDFFTMSPGRITQSKKHEELFSKTLAEIKEKLNGK